MALHKKYQPGVIEPDLIDFWQREKVYHFDPGSDKRVFSIDTPPPTVSGNLHLGHVYSYTHADIIARFWRMRGYNVFYPMGYDNNGLPTERLVEKKLDITAQRVGRKEFIEQCLRISEAAIQEYHALWLRAGLSVDWRYTYRTIDNRSRRICQLSFIELYRKGLSYRREAPAIWCPECHTTIAQAELSDLERPSEMCTLTFELAGGGSLPIATTRPELLPACVAIFVHPADLRYQGIIGKQAQVPLFGQRVPVLADPAADPSKGSGAVMCCTFGDTTDVAWWHQHKLPLIQAIDTNGRMAKPAGKYAGLAIQEARREIKQDLERAGILTAQQPIQQSVRVHERCDTPVEYTVTTQWFIRLLEDKDRLLKLGKQVLWHPQHMGGRYQSWVENLSWDWCISRQRSFGVPFPLWYCKNCGEVILAREDQLPVDPNEDRPAASCTCGSTSFIPETDVFDTWATSSMTPQIVSGWLGEDGNDLYNKVFPFSLRPQAHEIIRTWAFYTLVKSQYHFGELPWGNVLISGWGLAGEGMGKISKSRGGGPMAPLEMIHSYSADAVRYWAASTSPGKDTVISEEKIQLGAKLVTKLWNVTRFAEPFIIHLSRAEIEGDLSRYAFTPADRWILSRLQRLIARTTALLEDYDYAAAKSEIETFFWQDLADNYLEMCKVRMYGEHSPAQFAGFIALYQLMLRILQLLAPYLPFVTEAIYRQVFLEMSPETLPVSIHRSQWPSPDPALIDSDAEALGEHLVSIITAVRRYKSEHSLPLGAWLNRLKLSPAAAGLAVPVIQALAEAEQDLRGATRANQIEVVGTLEDDTQSPILILHSGIQMQIEV